MKGAIKRIFAGLLVLTSVFACACASPEESPENQTDTNIQWNDTDEELVTTKGIATNLTISIGGGEGAVWAKVKNNFTLLPSTIWVYVELYSSETYQESYTSMTLEKMDSVKDLDMGKSITISVPTGGQQKYWQARMRYKFDNRDWVTKTTSTFLYNSKGEVTDKPIEEPEKPVAKGPFYDLYSAYDKGMLTQEQLLNIAYYHHSESYTYDLNTEYNTELMGENYQPVAKSPEALSEDTQLTIKKSLRDLVYTDTNKLINLDDISVFAYYGTYNGGYAIRLAYSENDYGFPAFDAISEISVAGVKFFYPDIYSFFQGDGYDIGYQIIFWKPKVNSQPPQEEIVNHVTQSPVYSLQEAYENGWLTHEDLQSISNFRTDRNLKPPELSEDTAQTIKNEWIKYYKEKCNITEEFTATIHGYFGTYNDYAVVVIDRTGINYLASIEIIELEIDGIDFSYNINAPGLYVIKLGQPEIPNKEIFSLERAYKYNLLSKEDLKSIADYYNNPDTRPNDLDEATRETIRTAFCKQFGITNYDNVGVPSTYYGTYGGCTVVEILTSCDSEVGGDPICYPEYTIGGVTFYRYCPLSVYRKI